MRKLIVLSAAALLAGALAGGVQATPLSATAAIAMSGVADQAMPDQGVIKARWHQRHYGWSRGYHCLRLAPPRFVPRYARPRGSRNFQEGIQCGTLTIAHFSAPRLVERGATRPNRPNRRSTSSSG